MADYYPLIAKAVTGLDKSTGEARRALYARARNALVTQLRGVTPALSEQDITRERLALEEAIRKVEAEAARKSRFDPPPERRRVDLAEPPRPAAPAPREPPPAPLSEPSAPVEADPDDEHPESTLSGTAADLRRPVNVPPAAERASLSSDGLKGFRNVVADAENLGDATAQASRSARETYNAVPSPSPEFDRLEPRMEPEGLRARDRRSPPPEPRREPPPMRGPAVRQPAPSREPARDITSRDPAARDAIPRAPAARERTAPAGRDRVSPPRERAPARDPDDSDLGPRVDQVRANDFPRDYAPVTDFDAEYGGAPDEEAGFDAAPARPRSRRRVETRTEEDDEAAEPRQPWLSGRVVAYLAVGAFVMLLAGVIAWQWQPMVSALRGLVLPSRIAAPTAQPSAPPTRPKINDRIGANETAPGPQAAADVAQRVVLYEEDPDDSAGKKFIGSAVWRTEQVSQGAGQPAETVVRADIDIPDRKMTMKWSLQRNTDKTLPASHTVQVVFTLPPDFPHQGIQNVPGVLMKEAEQMRGVPLSGSAVKVTDGYFLIGLSAVDTEMQRNITLLKSRPWFDVPIVYSDGRRAILAVEKGTPGERAFNDAFTAWKQ
jgi:hypothetical protein